MVRLACRDRELGTMSKIRIFLAFALGCLAAFAFGFVANVKGRGDTSVIESRLDGLEKRVKEINRADPGNQIGNKVVAPFVVVDQARRPVFEVNPVGNSAAVNIHAGKGSATMENGGLFARSASGNVEASLDAGDALGTQGIRIAENSKERIKLGKNTKGGNYYLGFDSSAGKPIAATGESGDTHTAIVFVFDKSGVLRARMTTTTDGKGLVDVLGANRLPIAQLTESGQGGGKLWIGNSSGVGMVEAGDAGGYGIVRAGPLGFEFIPTPGLALPGSVIVGKR